MSLGMDVVLRMSARTLAWLDGQPVIDKFTHSVWEEITEMERAGHHPDTIRRLRRVLVEHRPVSGRWCRACPHQGWRRPRFPCLVWHELSSGLLSFARVQPTLGLPNRRRS